MIVGADPAGIRRHRLRRRLAFGILALLMWALLAPQDARSAFTGRTARFGGTSLLVTLLLLVALIGIYVVVRNAKLRADLTQTNSFSLIA